MIIINDGTDQIVSMKFYKPDAFSTIDGGFPDGTIVSGEYIGTTDGGLLSGATVTFHEYKKSNVAISSPVITWCEALQIWNIIIPATNVTQCGECILTVQKAGVITPATIKFQTVSTVDVSNILDEIIDPTHHNTPHSLARLLYILYCGEIGSILNTREARTILNENGQVIISNTIAASNTTVTRSGGHE